MADTILHKRSLTPDSIPTTASLAVGEIAINVNDGKLFVRRSGSLGDSIVPIVTTGITNSGSIIGSFTGSLFGTASFSSNAATASYYDTGSLLITASVSNATITLTKGNNSTFPLTINNVVNAQTASVLIGFNQNDYLLTSSFNIFTASYNTGSFSGSFTGSLLGTSSYASNADLLDGRDSTSFAGLTSNTFIGDQTITGSLNVSGTVSGATAQFTTITGSIITATLITGSSLVITASVISASTYLGINVGGGIPGGVNTNIQFNSGSTFSGSNNFNFNYVTNNVSLTGALLMSGTSYISEVDYIDFDVSASVPTYKAGRLFHDSNVNDLSYYLPIANQTLQIGQQTVVKVKNSTGSPISKGKLVRIIGGVGDNPLIATASWENDNNSANTLGMLMSTVVNNDFGYVLLNGIITGVNTDPATFTAGQIIFLSSSGDYTATTPVAPKHTVRLGEVVRAHAVVGSIFIKVDNGYELDELHNVLITSGATGDLLTYNSSSALWINSKSLTGSYTITGSLTVSGSSTFTNIGPAIFSGTINANNTLSGTIAQFTTLTASVISASTYIGVSASLLVTASVSNATLTFTKGDNSTFPLTINNVVNADTSSVSLDTQLFDGRDSVTFAGTGSNTFIGNQTITGTLDVTSTLSGSTARFAILSGSTITGSLGLFTQISASSISGTITNALTASYVLNAVSSSYASNADLFDNRDSTTFAGLTSNTFIGNQTITGSLNVSGNVSGTIAQFTTLTGSTITGSSALFTNLTSSNINLNTITGSAFVSLTTNNLIKYNPTTRIFGPATLITENSSAGTVTISGSVGLVVTGSVRATGLVIDGATTLGAGFSAGYSTQTTTFTVSTSSYFIGLDTTSGAITANFLGASNYIAGQMFVFKDIGGSAGVIGKQITILPSGSETVDNASGASITVNSGSLTIITDGSSKFYIIGTV